MIILDREIESTAFVGRVSRRFFSKAISKRSIVRWIVDVVELDFDLCSADGSRRLGIDDLSVQYPIAMILATIESSDADANEALNPTSIAMRIERPRTRVKLEPGCSNDIA